MGHKISKTVWAEDVMHACREGWEVAEASGFEADRVHRLTKETPPTADGSYHANRQYYEEVVLRDRMFLLHMEGDSLVAQLHSNVEGLIGKLDLSSTERRQAETELVKVRREASIASENLSQAAAKIIELERQQTRLKSEVEAEKLRFMQLGQEFNAVRREFGDLKIREIIERAKSGTAPETKTLWDHLNDDEDDDD